MTIKLIAMCDHEGCNSEIELDDDEDRNGWGATYIHKEDFCPDHWPQYCKDNNMDPVTGIYLID